MVLRDELLRDRVVERPEDERRLDEPPVDERLEDERLEDERRDGTLAPFSLASDSPIAIACLRLVTRPPCPDFPRFNVPFLRRCIALSTDLDAASP